MQIDPEAAVAEAIRAPSSHNTQPWLFERTGAGSLRLLADRTRGLPVNDPEDRELTMSCAAALLTLRVAAAGLGSGTRVTLLPEADAPDVLATVVFAGAPEPELEALAPAIGVRRTHRGGFGGETPSAEMRAALRGAAEAEGAALVVLDPAAREGLAELVAEGDAALWADPRWRRELAMWMHPRRRGDGLSMPGAAVPVARFAVRHFDMGARVGAQDAERARAAPVVAVLGTPGDAERDWMAAGMALARVLLVAAGAGLQAGYLNQPLQAAHQRPKVQALVPAAGVPQAVLCLGRPDELPDPAPRRPLGEVLIG